MKLPILAATLSALMLTACGGSGGTAPTGQVLATVNGEEITAADVAVELDGARAQDPNAQKQLQIAALQSIVNRIILAQAARDADVDSTPTAATVKRKAEQLAIIQLLERQLRSRVPAPSREEAQQFIDDNPVSFAQRRIFLVDQIIVPSPPPALLRALEPIETMAGVQAELAKYNLPTRPTFGVIDALTIDTDAARQISELAADAVFIVPGNGDVRINRIRETQIVPLTGNDALTIATSLLQERRIQEQLGNAVQGYLRAGQSNVRYNPEYDPARNRPAQPRGQAQPAAPAPASPPAPATK